MSANLGSLVVSLGLDAAQFVDGLTKQQRQAQSFARSVTSNVTRIAGTFALITGAAAAPIAALRAMTGEMDNVSKAALRASMPTEQFSALAYAGNLADVSMESLTTTMGRLARAQSDAARSSTSQQAQAFRQLGIEVKSADGQLRSTSEVFEDFADRFEEFGGSPEIVAAGMAIFGRSFQELIPLLAGGRKGIRDAMEEAKAFGVVMSTEAGKQAEAFNDNLSRLGLGLIGMKRQIVSEALPAAVALTDQFVELAKQVTGADGPIRKLVEDGTLKRWAENAAIGIAVLGESLYFVAKAAGVAAKSFGAVWADIQVGQAAARNMFGGFLFESNRKAFSDALSSRNKVVEGANAALLDLLTYDGSKISRELRDLFEKGIPESPTRATRALQGLQNDTTTTAAKVKADASRIRDYLDSLFNEVATFGMGDSQRRLFDFEIMGASPAQIDQARQLLSMLDGLKRAQDEARRFSEVMNEGRRVFEDTRTPLEKLDTQIIRLNDLLAAGAINWDTYARAVFAAQDQFDEANKKVDESAERAKSAAKDLGMTFSSAFEDAIVEGKKLSEVFKGLEQDILRIITRNLVTEPLAKALTGAMGGSGFFGSLFGGGRASGGPVQPGKFYEVNERRNEILSVNGRDFLMAGAAGRVRPNPVFTKGSQPVSVNMTVVANDVESFRRSEAQVTTRLGMALNRGGRFA